MEEKRTSVFENGLIWFGAAVSIAEILTETYFAPLGFTTTFLDAYSAGVSSESLSSRISGKWVAVAVTVIGAVGAIFLPLTDITDFLYLIGSVFAPMIAIQIADFFILKQNKETSAFSIQNLIIWLIGFVIYRLLMHVDIAVGNTLPDMLITIVICVAVSKARRKIKKMS